MTVLFYLSLFFYLVLCVVLSFIILIQESKSFGLGASLGGGDSGSSVFGTSTAQILKKFTGYLAFFFMASCVILSVWTHSLGRSEQTNNIPVIEETVE
jgi:preprotein translocase subunit SecG